MTTEDEDKAPWAMPWANLIGLIFIVLLFIFFAAFEFLSISGDVKQNGRDSSEWMRKQGYQMDEKTGPPPRLTLPARR